MLFKELSPTGGVLQLPKLVVGKLSTDYFEVITDFYEVVLDQSVYKVSQVYLGSDGKPKLELVPNEINVFNDILYFTGKGVTGLTSQDAVTTIANPMQTVADAFLDQSPVWVPAIEELSFFSNIELNTPRDIFKLAATYRMNQWKAGAGVSWQSDIYRIDNGVKVTQDSYALLNLMAGYDFTRNLSATLNVYNVANEKYINSLYWSQGYYGAPRNAMLSVSWKL
ncbi:MAG: TonB-dependent receptor [Gammaproteobacteria bacterium]|nr:TonB-dependent receptor [Gammaproteobacteria bacterium]